MFRVPTVQDYVDRLLKEGHHELLFVGWLTNFKPDLYLKHRLFSAACLTSSLPPFTANRSRVMARVFHSHCASLKG